MFVSERKELRVRALFVQHDHVSPVGPIGARLGHHGYAVEELVVVPEDSFHRPGVDVDFPDPRGYDVIVPMGAPWSVYDHDLIGTWAVPELDLLRAAHTAGVPVLGICFGGQALATALGGAVVASPEVEIGWHRVDTDEPDLVEAGPWFQWHHDRWVAPPGARTLARTAMADQAFVLGRSLAVQFHPELTPSMLAGWLDNGGRGYLDEHGVDVDALLERTAGEADDAERRAHRLVDRFLDQVARRDVVATTGASDAPS
jgi:GMP synthase-like glutamine amidotransferase